MMIRLRYRFFLMQPPYNSRNILKANNQNMEPASTLESGKLLAGMGAMRHDQGVAFQRMIYSESDDEIANGKARVPSEIDPNDPTVILPRHVQRLLALW